MSNFFSKNRTPAAFGMFAAMLGSVSFAVTGGELHEIFGAAFCALAAGHAAANARFFKACARGSFTAERAARTFLAFAVLALLAAVAASGLFHSKFLLGFLGIDSPMWVRQIHAAAAYWLFFLSSAHLGFREHSIAEKIAPNKIVLKILQAALWAAAAYGIIAWNERGMFGKLFCGYTFDFSPEDESAAGFAAKMFSISVLTCKTARIALWSMRAIKKG